MEIQRELQGEGLNGEAWSAAAQEPGMRINRFD